MRILKIFNQTISDGPGLRYSIYFSGCSHNCFKCHNKESWDPKNGALLDDKFRKIIKNELLENSSLDGITLSGGDPFYDPEELLVFLKWLRSFTKLNLWVFTGYTFEELEDNKVTNECLKYIDVIVDGKFEYENFDPNLQFRGSTNQNIIKIKH